MTDAYLPIAHTRADQRFYQEMLEDFLPERLFDMHVHIWRERDVQPRDTTPLGWAGYVEKENPVDAVKRDYETMLPGKAVKALAFGWVSPATDLDENNRYIGRIVRENPGWAGLAVTKPTWDADTLHAQVEDNGLVGMKPYVTFAPPGIRDAEMTLYDILTPAQLRVADERGYVCVLHLPRPGRIKDPVNLAQLLEIEERYPNVRLIVAHIGRAYCEENLGDAMERLQGTRNMCFDFSGNTNRNVIRAALEAFGSERIVFGSDLPLTHIHMRRVYEDGTYVNLVPAEERAEMVGHAHMRLLPEGETATYYLYESLKAFVDAARDLGLSKGQISDVMYGNAMRILGNQRT